MNTDELTPTYKLKRGFVDTKFKAAIDAMYAKDSRTYIPFVGGNNDNVEGGAVKGDEN